MDIQTLEKEQKAFAKVDATNEMKRFAFDFAQRHNLTHLKGVTVYALLRDEQGYVAAWKKMQEFERLYK